MNKKLLFASVFIVLGLIALQLPINQLAASKVKFTGFDLFAPTAGAFLGIGWAIASVFVTQVANLMLHGVQSVDRGAIIRLFPTLFGLWYFATSFKGVSLKGGRIIMLIPLLSILVFIAHPVGRTVWFYSLFWLIPFVVWPFRERFLLLRSLGATFVAHSVGGAIWIWAFNLPATVWISLIPVVVLERAIFALGISASYIMFNNLFGVLARKKLLPRGLLIESRYLLPTLRTKTR
ncbi:hypothetical protein HYW39_01635 [Candidatus Curtissbacteria bacterium]|nr:hypothetical protein [Candidatus Curtissbacteria bacterium]